MTWVTTWGPNRLFAPNRLNRRSRSMHRRLPSQGKDVTYLRVRYGRSPQSGARIGCRARHGDRGPPHRSVKPNVVAAFPHHLSHLFPADDGDQPTGTSTQASRQIDPPSNVRRLICKLALRPCRPGILGRVLDDGSLARSSRRVKNGDLARHGQRLLWFGWHRLNDGWP